MEDALAGGVLLGREHVCTLKLGEPGKVGRKPGVIQLVWAVEPLVRKPRLGKGGPVSLDPLVVSDARGQVVHYIQKLELGSVNEHDTTVLLRSVDAFVLGHDRDKVLADKLEIVVARVEADHRHLVEPGQDTLSLLLRDTVNVWKPELVYHIRSDSLKPPLQGLVEEMDQLVRVFGDNVLRLRDQGVRNGYGDGYVLAFIRKVPGWVACLGLVLIRLEVVDNRVGVSLRLLLRTASVCPGGWGFVFPLFDHCVTSVTELLGSHQSQTINNLPCDCPALAVPAYQLFSLGGLGVALSATVP